MFETLRLPTKPMKLAVGRIELREALQEVLALVLELLDAETVETEEFRGRRGVRVTPEVFEVTLGR